MHDSLAQYRAAIGQVTCIDEQAAMDAIVALINDKFGEGE